LRATILSALILGALIAPAALDAQALPLGRDDFADEQRRFRSSALSGAQVTLTEFRGAWRTDDLQSTLGHLTDDAFLALPGRASIRGRRAIQRELRAYLTEVGSLDLTLVDTESGGSMVYVHGRYLMADAARDHTGTVVPSVGTYTAVLHQSGRGWRIRALVFSPEPASTEEEVRAAGF
jgi:ketosteroid isomerase-like protein